MRPVLRLLDRFGFVVVPADDLTLLRSSARLIHVYTGRGLAGCATRPPLRELIDRYPADWLWLSRSAVVRRSAILRIDRDGRRHPRYAARVAGVPEAVSIAGRAWPAVRESLGG